MNNHRASRDEPFRGTFGSLENLVDRISDVLKCPITIEDANHKLLAYSSHDNRTDPARIATIIGRRVPEHVLHSLWKEGVIPALLASDQPVRVNEISDIGLGNRVAIAIRKNEDVLGYIWALEIDHPMDQEQIDLLTQAASAAKHQLIQLQVRRNQKEEGYQEFFWQLLTGHLHAKEDIDDKLSALGLPSPASIAILVFRFHEEPNAKTQRQISYVLRTTQRIHISFHTYDRRDLILLVSPLSNKPTEQPLHSLLKAYTKDFIKQMKEKFQVEPIQGGCGTIYPSCTNVQNSYKEALTVLSIKERFTEETEAIFSYHDLGIYRFIDHLLDQRKKDGFENPALQQIRSYDRQHHTQLLETLETFLNKDSNINDTAKALHIHVNSLNYRLKRITNIAEIDLKNMNQKTALFLDLKIEKLRQARS